MAEVYDVICDNISVGTATVTQQGLYCRIDCVFRTSREDMFRIFMSSGKREVDLGICIKTGEGYEVHTRIPLKQVEKPLSFTVRVNGDRNSHFYPIKLGEPFDHIKKLPLSRLATEKGNIGITYPE